MTWSYPDQFPFWAGKYILKWQNVVQIKSTITADGTKFGSCSNAFVMLKFGNLFVMIANPFLNLKFEITFIHNTKVKHKLRVCHEYKSETLVDNMDLHVMQIPNLAEQFLVDTYLLSNSKYVLRTGISTGSYCT
jgi:hypothetical protein